MLSIWLAIFFAKLNNTFPAVIAASWQTVILVTSLMVALPAQSATVYCQTSDAPANAHAINSSVTIPDGSDQDTTTLDNFTLPKSAMVTSVSWRGSSTDYASTGFIITIYPPQTNPAAQANLSNPLAEITETGKANENVIGNNLSDYRATFQQPVELNAGKQYWISIVAVRNFPSPWAWSSGSGGDGISTQSFSELRILHAPKDRAFSLFDGSQESSKK